MALGPGHVLFGPSECLFSGLYNGARVQTGPAPEVVGESGEELTGALSRGLVPSM